MDNNQNAQPPIAPVLLPTKKQRQKGMNKHHWKFFFGWFVGFIFTILLLGGIFLWAFNNLNLKKIEGMTGADLSFLGDDLKEMNFSELASTVTDLADNYENYTFEELSDKYGIINLANIVTVSGVGESKTYDYKTIDLTPVMKGKIGEVGNNLKTAMENATLGQIETAIGFNLPDLILFERVKGASLKTLGEALSDLKNTYTLQEMANDFNMNLDNSDILKNLKNKKLVELPDEIDNMTVEELVGTAKVEGNKIVEAIRGIKIGDLPDELPKLTVNQILGVSTSDNIVLKAIGGSTLEALEANISALTFRQLFPAPTEGPDTRHEVIKKLADKNIALNDIDGNMGQIIDELTISEIFNFSIEENSEYVEGVDKDYKQYKANQGIWALIYAEGGDVKVIDLGTKTKNIISTATLGSLVWHGIVTSTSIQSANLETIQIGTPAKSLADCNIVEIIDYVIETASAS